MQINTADLTLDQQKASKIFTPGSKTRKSIKFLDVADSVIQGHESVIEKVDNVVIEPVKDEVGRLQIEIHDMETKMMILTKQLNLMTDTEEQVINLKKKNKALEEEKEKHRLQNLEL